MADVNVRRILRYNCNQFKCCHLKVCKKKNLSLVQGTDRQICPSGLCLASFGRASLCQNSDPWDCAVRTQHSCQILFHCSMTVVAHFCSIAAKQRVGKVAIEKALNNRRTRIKSAMSWPRGYKTIFVLNSAEIEIYPAHKC